jgi:3-hydroxyacyl-CoA dehydrogenase
MKDVTDQAIRHVAVVGAGTVGASWATLFSRAGLTVSLYDSAQGQLERALDRVRRSLRIHDEEAPDDESSGDLPLSRLVPCASLEDALRGAHYVQEALPEVLEMKQQLFATADDLTDPSVIIASSASALRASEICAAMTRAPERGLVVHPTNPPHIVPLVELVPGERTSGEVVARARALMEAIGQRPIVCRKDIYGYVLNRLQMALAREAFWLAREGVASVADIDASVTEGLGLRWALLGPFAVEETNGADIEEDLRKFGPHMRALMDDVARHGMPWPEERDIRLAIEGIASMYPGVAHEQLLEYRDRMVLRIRQLKRATSPAGAGFTESRLPL